MKECRVLMGYRAVVNHGQRKDSGLGVKMNIRISLKLVTGRQHNSKIIPGNAEQCFNNVKFLEGLAWKTIQESTEIIG